MVSKTVTAGQQNGETKPPQKQSLDYISRTGLAGGLAGCAVSASRVKKTQLR
jgi:hypothetical protein